MMIKALVELLEKTAATKPNINYVGVGNVYDLNTKADAEYSVVWITPIKTTVTDNGVNHTVTLFYIDRLTDNLDNRLSIQSDGMKALMNIINTVKWSEDVEVNLPIEFTPFNQRFMDDCAGVFANVVFTTDGEGDCYFE